jgi:hypothetical protein
METFRKTIAALCTLLFIISGIAALLAFNIEWYAFNSTAYKQAFERQNLYVRTPEILANALYSYISGNQNADPYLKELTPEDWQGTIASAVPPEELKLLTDSALDSVFDYLNDRTNSVQISLLPIKQRLAGPAGVEIVQKILRSQPECTADQLVQMGMGFLSGNIGLCNPPPELIGLLNPLIESQVQLLTFSIPNEVILLSSTPSDAFGDPRARLRQVRTLMNITPVFPVFFLFCLTIFAVRSLTDWLQWWGYPFLLTGGVSVLIAVIGAPIVGILVQSILEFYSSGLIPPILFSVIREAISAVTGEILRPVFYESLILAAIGFSMVLTSLFIISRRNPRM